MSNKVENLVRQIVEKGYIMSLATFDDGGLWVSDLMYVADDNLTLYWISETNVRHSKAIHSNPNAWGYFRGENRLFMV